MRIAIYRYTNRRNGKRYVGQTASTPEQRWNEHLRDARKGRGTLLAKAIRKYGADAFVREVIDVVTSQAGADRAETVWIERYDCRAPNGYNLASGGRVGRHHATTRAHLSEIASSQWARRTPDERESVRQSMLAAHAAVPEETRRERGRRASASRDPAERSATARRQAEGEREMRSARTKAWMATLTPEERSEAAKRGNAKLTPEERKARAVPARLSRPTDKRRADAIVQNAAMTPDERRARSVKGWATRRENLAKRAGGG